MARGEGRANICEAAVRLFNERGYDAVSLRQIAAEAGTTIGNLTYHFRRKEDLLVAVLADLHGGYADMLDRSLAGDDLLARLVALFAESEANQARYPFYFGNLAQIMVSAPSLREGNDAFVADIYAYYVWALRELRDEGAAMPTDSDAMLDVVAYSLVAMQAGWTQQSSPYNNESLPRIGLARALCNLLYAHVAEGHRDAYLRACGEAGVAI